MLSATMSTAVSGLRAMQKSLDTYSKNIANADTPGYRVKDMTYQDRINGGVNATVHTSFDALTATRVSQLDGLSAETQAKSAALAHLDNSLSTTGSSLSSVLDGFRQALGKAADNPADASLRDIVAARATSLASEATAGMSVITAQLGDLAKQQTQTRDAALVKIDQLVSLNKDAQNYPDNLDIRDRQAQAGRELADLVGGEITFLPTGQTQFTVGGTLVVNGLQGKLPPPDRTGGTLGGLQAAQATVEGYRATLASTFSAFSGAMNATNAQGVDSAGAAGGDLFSFDGYAMKFVGTAGSLALDSAGSINGDNARKLLGLDSLGKDVSQLAAKAAVQTKAADAEFSSRSGTLNYALEQQNAREGVDLDQQTVLMSNAQKLYEANAKVIQTQSAMFGTLLNILA